MSVPWNLRSRQPGDELAELLWDNNGPHFPSAPFQPFTCSAAGSNRVHELLNKRHAATDVGIPVHHLHDGDQDMPPWLHCPVIDDGGDSDTAPLPPDDYCAAGLLSGYPALHAAAPQPQPEPTAAPAGAVPPETTAQLHPGNGVMNFTFFSRPLLQRPHPSSVAATSPTNPQLESTVVPQTTAASRLRNTPLFSEQRMAWLQPPPPKGPRASPAPPPPPPPPQLTAPPATDPHVRHAVVVEAAATVTRHALRPDARAVVTSSSVCSGNGDDQLLLQDKKKTNDSHHPPTAADYSVSPDEDVDDEPGAAARRSSAARGTKRSRTAEVHNLSERRRRDRINEKMRALQELIPNCNKIDKASMLEEAIEYLKTLQLQLQMMMMMSMGTAATGICGVPPMPMPMLMQHHVASQFPHLGMGQLGFGMGAAAAAAAYDMLPRFTAAGAQFPCPVMPGAAAPMALPHGSVFGIMPGAGHVIPSPTPPFLHVNGTAAPATEQREGADNGSAPGGGGSLAGAGDHRPPPPVVPIAPQGGDRRQNLQQQQHSKPA